MVNEEGLQGLQSRSVTVPESVVRVVQTLGVQLTRYDERSGRRRIDMARAMPVCMILANNDVARAAQLLDGFVDALDSWGASEQFDGEQDFTGQPVP